MTNEIAGDPDVSVVVVNYDGATTIRGCVESLLDDETPTREILLVDNASRDESAAVIAELEREHPPLQVLRSSSNRGYAGAVNLALPRCRGRFVAVLNMDLEAEPGWLAPLVELLDARPEVGAVNPMLALKEGESVNALGQDIHVSGLGFNRGLGQPRASVGETPHRVCGIQGAAFLVRRTLLEQMGGMDASGFLYHEDVNLSWLLRMMGHDLYCVPSSVMRHDYFLSMHPEKLFLLERNRLALLRSYLRPGTLLRLSPMLLLTELMLWGYATLRGRGFLAAKLRSYAWVWRHRRQLAERRALAEGLRRCSDRQVLACMRWRYEWRQFALLAGERGAPRQRLREPPSATAA